MEDHVYKVIRIVPGECRETVAIVDVNAVRPVGPVGQGVERRIVRRDAIEIGFGNRIVSGRSIVRNDVCRIRGNCYRVVK